MQVAMPQHAHSGSGVSTVPAHLQRSDFLINGSWRHAPEQSNKLGVVARVIPRRQQRSEAVAASLTYTSGSGATFCCLTEPEPTRTELAGSLQQVHDKRQAGRQHTLSLRCTACRRPLHEVTGTKSSDTGLEQT